MALGTIKICKLEVSRFTIGGNPFGGFSHQTPEKDIEMIRYYTTARIKENLCRAEKLGINTHIGRGDQHTIRVLKEYWDEGGTIQWIAQTCPEYKSLIRSFEDIRAGGASACYIHGGYMDFLFANSQTDGVQDFLNAVRDASLPAGIAGHNPEVFKWAEEYLDVDFYLCSYYNPTHRDKDAEHISGMVEWFLPEDRDIMVSLIQRLTSPVIHYKVLAAGRNDPKEAFRFVVRNLRPQDAVGVGVYTKTNQQMIEEDVGFFETAIAEHNNCIE